MRLALRTSRYLALPTILKNTRAATPPPLLLQLSTQPLLPAPPHHPLPSPRTTPCLRCTSISIPLGPGSLTIEPLTDDSNSSNNGDTNGHSQQPQSPSTPPSPQSAAAALLTTSSPNLDASNGHHLPSSALSPPPLSSASAPSDKELPPMGDVRTDLARIMGLALPLMLQNLFGYLLSIFCTVSIGRIGAPELAASALANSLYVVTGWSMLTGLCSAMETLCGQAYGAGQYKVLGEVLQRALLLCWLACVPVALLWANSAGLMVAVGQDPAIAAMAGRYLALCIPCVFLGILADCLKKYLQAQSVVAPAMYATAASTLLAPLYFWGLVHKLGLGLDGAAAAFILCQLTTLVGLAGYIVWFTRRETRAARSTNTWGGFSLAAATSNWLPYLRYGVPAMVMLSLDWWVYEGAVIMTGWLPNAQVALSVGGICMQLNSWSYMVPLGLSSAVNTVVSNALGAGHGPAARRAALLGLACSVGVQLGLVAALNAGGRQLVQLISGDALVLSLAMQTLPVLCCLVFWDGINAVLNGVLRGCGEQAVGAAISTAYLCLCLPLCYFLTFVAPEALIGLPLVGAPVEPVARVWMGVVLGSFCQCMALLTVISRWDWNAKARQAVKAIAANSSRP